MGLFFGSPLRVGDSGMSHVQYDDLVGNWHMCNRVRPSAYARSLHQTYEARIHSEHYDNHPPTLISYIYTMEKGAEKEIAVGQLRKKRYFRTRQQQDIGGEWKKIMEP